MANAGLDYPQPVRIPRLFAQSAALIVLAAACIPAAASAPAVPAHLRVATALVLHVDDVKSGATQSLDTALTADDAAAILGIAGLTGDLFAQNGFVNGYVRAFAWKDASPLAARAMACTTYLFADPVGAHDTLSLIVRTADEAGVDRMSLGASVGDESAGFQIDTEFKDLLGASISMTTTGVVFRHANALSLVSYRAPSNQDDPGYVIALARKQLDLQKAVAPVGVTVPELVAAPRVESFGSSHTDATKLVLSVKDVPGGMRARNEGTLTAQAFAGGDADTGAMFESHGFLSAYGRVFTRGSQFGKEATVIRSETAILADNRGAHEAFLDLSDLASAVGARALGTVGAGDESRAFRLDDYEEDASYIEILFRHRNAVSIVEIQFPARLVNEALSVDLATKQVTRQLVDLGMLKPLR